MTDTQPDVATQGVSDAAELIDRLESAGMSATEFADAVAVLDALRWLKAAADVAYRAVEGHALEIMGDKRIDLPGFGTVEAKRAVKRTDWQHEDLLRAVLDARPVNPDTGEIAEPETPVERITRVYGLKGYQASITAIRALGLDVGEFCHQNPEGWSLKLPGLDKG